MIADTIIRQGEAIPADIGLYVPPDWALAFPSGAQETTIFLWVSETEAQSGADDTDIVVTRILPNISVTAPIIDSKLKRRSGAEWVSVGTIVVYQ